MLNRLFLQRLLPSLLLLSLLVAGCAVNPVTQESEFTLLSEEQEIRMGEEAYPPYTQASGGLFTDDALQAYVSELGQALAALGHRPHLNYEFNVVNGSMINAYALPGGKISITRGLLEKMDNEAQLAAVLGHEVGHVTAKHAAAGYTRQQMAGLGTALLGVGLDHYDVSGKDLIARGGMVVTQLVLTKYSRDQERQSDELGMEYMVAAGHNPEGLAQTMAILRSAHEREPSTLETFFSSHPPSSEREETAKARLETQPAELRTEERLGRDRFQAATAYLRKVAPAYAKEAKAKALLQEDKDEEALTLLREATGEAPDEAMLFVTLAAAEMEAKNLAAAAEAAARAVALYPGLYHAQLTAGLVAFEREIYKKSLGHLDRADEIVPGQPLATFYRGRNHEELGDREAAAQAYYAFLQKVRKGKRAEYAYTRLVEWGYIRPAQ